MNKRDAVLQVGGSFVIDFLLLLYHDKRKHTVLNHLTDLPFKFDCVFGRIVF